jgi:hypothetical protein
MKKLIATDPVWICGSDLIGSDIQNFGWEARMYEIWHQKALRVVPDQVLVGMTLMQEQKVVNEEENSGFDIEADDFLNWTVRLMMDQPLLEVHSWCFPSLLTVIV